MIKSIRIVAMGIFNYAPFIAQASTQAPLAKFDLVCSLKFTGSGDLFAGLTNKFEVIHLRVDLNENKCCSDSCTSIAKMKAIGDSAIIFYQEVDLNGEYHLIVNRLTGEASRYASFKGTGYYSGTGLCEKRVFSGFPAKKF